MAGITRIADVTGLDRLNIPVAVVTRPNSRGFSVSQGKGLDFTGAKVSGAMEGLESFHAERIDRPLYFLRWSELAGADRVVDLDRLPRLRNSLFHADKRIPWISATDLLSGRERLVPFELIHTDFSLPALPGTGCFPRSSNGLASGNSFSEAAVHGLCELIERDAYALYLWHPERGVRVDISTVSDSVLGSLVERVAKAGCSLIVRDITSDIGVPVFWATITGGDSAVTAAPAGGLGCHPDRVWACVRAITEAAQSRATRLSGARDDLTRRWFQPMNTSLASVPEHDVGALQTGQSFCGETIEDDLRWLLDRLNAKGFDSVLAVDLSRPEFGLPVLRLVVPGLEHPGDDAIPGPRAFVYDV
ncbi:YcaO-like family protein [Microvirga terrae]|uniref:YcaO-like family protein n=2 Tax=Methylobacteriaceae TaxID=119045 RepID=A0ABY5RRI8_9HYPH|nr:YcaO-like family protein [Microvirga terrae]UVF18822.1 YcaO-like family protein [Microvirga terrae]